MLIDFHTHCFPDALAPRAMAALRQNCSSMEGLVAHTNGTAADLKRVITAAGITHAVICNIATNPRQESNVNSFAISMAGDDFFSPLGSLHPDSLQMESELERLAAAGIRGIKIHPDYVGLLLSDKRFDRILSLARERDFFVVVHAGFDPISPNLIHATPQMFAHVLKQYKGLKLVAAHMGGFCRAAEVLKHLVGTDIYMDTSLSGLRREEWPLLEKILKEHDSERLLFGTDSPWGDAKAEVAFLAQTGLDEERLANIRYRNGARLLGLEA